ncbi:alpha-(1-_3)-arabinofuranosyltransferase domain-containing protein [Actinomadura flavalba]|uniref:alpha-(1->3)-arabinofuranosyltransferase domain-containing protein n=1 Tax=Actinomadura flavalba TaxID=1120938 RepID=UPI0003A1B122|nr:alpha-(1->3)-arabinofuranosyltransferase family protein [Actinomadura flavalba]
MTGLKEGYFGLADRFAVADRDDRPDRAEIDDRLRERLRVVVCCLGLLLLSLATRPGRILADTKIDMAVNPAGFLARALHLWDAAHFGQLQNQAVGYFFPMGPYYALTHAIGLPVWVAQRFWFALLLVGAFLGARKLAERLGIGGPISRLAGGLAYALAPHGLSALGQNSWEYLPLAALPWIVLPLVTAARGETGRVRAAARSGVAIALCGGINGTATVAVLAVPALYLLTRPRGVRKFRLTAWWTLATVTAVGWWLVPLVLTGRYGFSWLGYTEDAGVTTATTGLVNTLRGAERWGNYLDAGSLPVGHALSTGTALTVATVLLAALGLAGLLRRDLPDRAFFLLVLLAGVAIIGMGHASTVEGPLAAPLRDLLDGPLAPLRNLYKFDGLVRLPLALGLVHLLVTVRKPRVRLGALLVSAVTVGAVALPAATTGLAGPGDFPAVPKYWHDAAGWLNERAGEQAVLALPGAAWGDYTWGRPTDDIVQPLLKTRWGARQLVPQGSPGYARLMDAIDQRVAAGRGSAGLTEVLARMGVRYLLVRNDLSRADLRGAWPGRVHEALETSPGIKRAAFFGILPAGVGGEESTGSFDHRYPPVEIYEVAGAAAVTGLVDAAGPLRLTGAPEGLLGLADNGALKGRPVFVGDDEPGAKAAPVTSDALRWRERNRAEIRAGIGPTLTAREERDGTLGRGTDPEEPGWDGARTTAAYTGIADVTASSSAADTDAPPGLDDPAALPFAAVDGDPATRWISGGWRGGAGQWLRVDLTGAVDPGQIEVAFAQNAFLGPPPSRVTVETERGTLTHPVRPAADPQPLPLPRGPTRWVKVRIASLASAARPASRVAITELTFPGLSATRHLVLPETAGAQVMQRVLPPASECMRASERWACSPSLGRGDEEGETLRRAFTAAPGAARVTGSAVATDPALIERLTRGGSPVRVTGTSAWTPAPASLPRSAFDGDPATTWVPAADDPDPALTVAWRGARRIGQISVERPPAAQGGLRVKVAGANGDVREGIVDGTGRFTFQPLRTDRLTVTFTSAGGQVQVTELRVPGVPALPAAGPREFTTRCGYGPDLDVNGKAVPTRVTGTTAAVLGGRALRFEACANPRLKGGENLLNAGGDYRVDSVVVDPGGRLAAADPVTPGSVDVTKWGQGERTVQVDAARASYLVVNENFNTGWTATVGGRELRPARLDGWRQAWEVPAGTSGSVRLLYEPDYPFRLSLLVGLDLLVLLLLVAFWPRSSAARGAFTAPAPGRGWPRVAALALAGGLGFWIAGFPGLAVTVAVGAAVDLVERRPSDRARRLRSPWPYAGAFVAAGLAYAAGTWLATRGVGGADVLRDAVPQLLALAALGRLAMLLAAPRDPDTWLAEGVQLRWEPAPAEEPSLRTGSSTRW